MTEGIPIKLINSLLAELLAGVCLIAVTMLVEPRVCGCDGKGGAVLRRTL